MAEAIDFSKTQRILLLIDLNPLLHLQNPNPYLTSILTSSQILLTNFPSLSSSSSSFLSSFKFFFSSLSPLLSSSKLPTKSSHSLSFDHPSNTLLSLSTALKSLPPLISQSGSSSSSTSQSSRALHIASSLRQILHDYAWDYQLEEEEDSNSVIGTLNCINTPVVVRSNLVVLFSPFCKDLKCLAEFIDLDLNDELLVNADVFCEMFRGVFDSVNVAFVSKDIHLSWVDVKFELECTEAKVEIDECDIRLGFLEKGIKSLGWGFCSTDSIVLGSALVPFGLIYPMIGVSSNLVNANDYSKKVLVKLILQISDVSGKPLDCKCCDLNLVNMKMLPGNRFDNVLQGREFINSQTGADDLGKTFWEQFSDGVTKLLIKAVQRYDEPVNIEGRLSDIILVHGFSGEFGKDKKVSYQDGVFFADRVFRMVMMEMGGCMQSKSVPIWPLLLSFLYEKGYWGVVSVSKDNGDSCMGILKPFTVHSAFLFIVDNKLHPQNTMCNIGGLTDNGIHKSSVGINNSIGYADLLSGTIPRKDVVSEEDRRKKIKRKSHLYKDLTWSSFCKAAFEQSKMDLGRIYFARECNNSKKLKFLNCWMKQMKKSKYRSLTIPDGSKPHQDNLKETEERLTNSQQESELAISSSASAAEDFLTEASRVQDEAAPDFCSESVEVFFSSLSKKIRDGLESEGVDLGALAERLVNSTIYWLYKKHENDTKLESQPPMINPDDTCGCIDADELMKLLLWEPKELVKHHKNNDPSLLASDPRSTGMASETIAREYEMQILFRMEILRSEIATSIDESRKQKFLKQICLLLEKIQCQLEGGFFGDWSLDNYVGRIIKNRYSHTLGDVVHRIYKKMDLLPFVEEDEPANPLLNSEDSNQSWRDKLERDEMGENNGTNESVSADDESFQPLRSDNMRPPGIKQEEHALRLIEVQNRRERARRSKHFTRLMPDLRRVWAPKQVKPMRDSSLKLSKRKSHRRTRYDTVCETPMTGNKRSCPQESSPGEEEDQFFGSNSCYSVSKALFQDDR